MTTHALLNEETGELEVSQDLFTLMDGMVEVLESAGYEIEAGMEAEEFIEQVAEVLANDDKDLDEAKRKSLGKSHASAAHAIKTATLKSEGSEDDDDKGDDEKPAKGNKPDFLKNLKKGKDKKDDDKGDDDEKDADDKGDDDDADDADEDVEEGTEETDEDAEVDEADEDAEETDESEEVAEDAEEVDEDTEGAQEETTIADHLKGKTQPHYGTWKNHKPKRGTHYVVKHAKLKKG